MRRRRTQILMTALLGGALTTMTIVNQPVADAAPPPLTGDVSCTMTAASTFNPPLAYQRGRLGKKVAPNKDSTWKLDGDLTGCTGTQTGGSPRYPDPIEHGEILVKAKTTGHQCSLLTEHGMTVKTVKVRWFDAAGNLKSTTKGTGTATVTGLGNGSKYSSFFGPVIDPNYVEPGIITIQLSALGKPNSKAFANQALTMTAVADETIDSLPFICHTVPISPGLTSGFYGLHFTGVNGPSSTTVS